MGDVAERKLWGQIHGRLRGRDPPHQPTPEAPWYVVPADNKRFARLVIAGAMVEAMERLDLHFPKVKGKALRR